jgi:hypothetical protein
VSGSSRLPRRAKSANGHRRRADRASIKNLHRPSATRHSSAAKQRRPFVNGRQPLTSRRRSVVLGHSAIASEHRPPAHEPQLPVTSYESIPTGRRPAGRSHSPNGTRCQPHARRRSRSTHVHPQEVTDHSTSTRPRCRPVNGRRPLLTARQPVGNPHRPMRRASRSFVRG